MQKDLLIDDNVKDGSIIIAFKWWEKKRPLYNILVGVAGIVPMIVFGFKYFNLLSLLGIVIYGIMANVCYCLGFMIELFIKHYFKSSIDFTNKHFGFFIVGTAFSVIVTMVIASLITILGQSQF